MEKLNRVKKSRGFSDILPHTLWLPETYYILRLLKVLLLLIQKKEL